MRTRVIKSVKTYSDHETGEWHLLSVDYGKSTYGIMIESDDLYVLKDDAMQVLDCAENPEDLISSLLDYTLKDAKIPAGEAHLVRAKILKSYQLALKKEQ